MTKDPPRNLAASVRSRLLTLAKSGGEDFTFVLTRYGLERLLYRLGRSSHAGDFVLKGAMLFPLWSGNPHRSTKDLDLLGFGSPDSNRLVRVFREVVVIPAPDGIEFLADTVKAVPIREDAIYDGIRVTLEAQLDAARMHLQVDVGFGDAVVPAPRETSYPTMLDVPAPVLRAYPREAVVAEKLHAMVDLGLANSRMKDFFDLWFLATNFSFDGATLGESIRSSFARRETAIPREPPVALTSEFAGDRQKQIQWTAFIAKSRLADPSPDLATSWRSSTDSSGRCWLGFSAFLADGSSPDGVTRRTPHATGARGRERLALPQTLPEATRRGGGSWVATRRLRR